jgi:hypothetical protein
MIPVCSGCGPELVGPAEEGAAVGVPGMPTQT